MAEVRPLGKAGRGGSDVPANCIRGNTWLARALKTVVAARLQGVFEE